MPEIFNYSSELSCTAEKLYEYHARPGALERLLPPWERTTVIEKIGSLDPGGKVTLKMHVGPLPLTWIAHHLENDPGKMFRDIQYKGPFKRFEHTHRFNKSENGVRLEDSIEFELPLQPLVPKFMRNQIKKMLYRNFRYREHVLREDLRLHSRYSKKPLRLLISGAGGVLGQTLVPLLTTGGHKVFRLVRRPPESPQEIFWDPAKQIIDSAAIPEIDAVIHLAGEYIGLSRWSDTKKRKVLESRINGTTLLAKTIAGRSEKPKTFLSASAIGYYGDRGNQQLNEAEPQGDTFLSEVCNSWEQATAPAQKAGIRTVTLRFGVGLTPQGGALERLLHASPFAYIRCFGSGNQYISWTSLDDMAAAIIHCIQTPALEGPVNIAAPTPVTNKELIRTLSQVTRKPRVHALPGPLLQAVYGQMAHEILLASCRVSSQKLIDSGFNYRHPELFSTLQILLGKR